MSNSGANFESIGGLPEYAGIVGSKTIRHIKSGINSWVKDNNGMPLEAFGAKWNGSADDSSSLQEAVEASIELNGAPILLPYGTGNIKSMTRVPNNLSVQVPIRGAGMYGTTVSLTETLQFLAPKATSSGNNVGNILLENFSINGNNLQEVESGTGSSVIYGTTSNSNNKINIENVYARRVRIFNVPTLEKTGNGRRSFILSVAQNEPGETLNTIKNCIIRECILEGAQYGVFVGAFCGSKLQSNVYISDIYVGDIQHYISKPAEAFGSSCNVQVGQNAWSDGKNIVVERIHGVNAGDVGIELDVPCTINDCWIENSNDTSYLFNTFNVATTKEPVFAKLTSTASAGATTLTVNNSKNFTVGKEIVIDISGSASNEVRTIKSLPSETSIELTSSTGVEHLSNIWIQEVGDMSSVKWQGRNLTSVRTSNMPGLNHSLTVQNSNNVRPAPEVNIDGYRYYRKSKGIPTFSGEIIQCETGTSNSPTGNPQALRIQNLKADVQGIENSGSETLFYQPVNLVMRGSGCPIDIQGNITVEGPGNTSTGKLGGRLVNIAASAILDIDLLTKWSIGSSGGEGWRGIQVNQESYVGDITGRIRHRTRKSVIESGGGTQAGVRLGKGCGFASQSVTTTLNTAELAKESTVIPVKSTEGFTAGAAIVVDALSSTKSEILVVKEVETGISLTVVKVGEKPGTKEVHTTGAVIAPLKTIIIEDSDWFGLGTAATSIVAEDENLYMRVITRGNVYSSPPASKNISYPGSEKAFQILQAGQNGTVAVEGGTVTAVEWSGNGKEFFKYASVTGAILPVSTGDFIKVTSSVNPTITFQTDRR